MSERSKRRLAATTRWANFPRPPKLTEQHHRVMAYLRGREWTSPTQIGADLHGQHSAWASPKCLRLVQAGLLERSARGWYRVAKTRRTP